MCLIEVPMYLALALAALALSTCTVHAIIFFGTCGAVSAGVAKLTETASLPVLPFGCRSWSCTHSPLLRNGKCPPPKAHLRESRLSCPAPVSSTCDLGHHACNVPLCPYTLACVRSCHYLWTCTSSCACLCSCDALMLRISTRNRSCLTYFVCDARLLLCAAAITLACLLCFRKLRMRFLHCR